MTPANANQEPTFGYLSIFNSAEHGYFGGYLVVSSLGRPLEFHCTAPVRPSRAQEILYGPTLQPYLIGEQIGGTLLAQAKLTPRLVVTDQSAALGLGESFDVPVAQILFPESPASNSSDAANLCGSVSADVVVAAYQFVLSPHPKGSQAHVTQLLSLLAERVDLAEPFDRIYEAIREAQRISGGDQDDQARAA